MAQLVGALRWKQEGGGFDWWFRRHNPSSRPGVDTASNKNEYQEYFLESKGGRCVGLITLPPSCAGCLEIWEPEPSGTFRDCPSLYRDCFTFTLLTYRAWGPGHWNPVYNSMSSYDRKKCLRTKEQKDWVFLLFRRAFCYDYFPYSTSCTHFIHFKITNSH